MSPFSSRSGHRRAASTLFRPFGLVEHLPVARRKSRTPISNGCRVRPASVGFRLRPLWIRIRKTESSAATPRRVVITLLRWTPTTRALDDIELPFTAISQVRVAGDRVVLIGASSIEPTSIVSLNLATKELEVLRRSRETTVDAGYLADPRAIEFPTEGGLTAHGHSPSNAQSRLHCAGKRKTAAGSYEPRWADLVELRIAEVFNPILGLAAGSPCST